MKRRPQWDDSTADRTQYRLTYAEQLQRKASLVSKNKESAREELIKRQELLKQGKIPEEIKKTIQTQSKKPGKLATLKKSSSFSKELPGYKDPDPVSNHFVQLKKTQKPVIEDQLESLNKLDQAMKELEQAMLKSVSSKPEGYQSAKTDAYKDETISEGSLFGLSDDEDCSKLSESKLSEKNSEVQDFKSFFQFDHNFDKGFEEYLKNNEKELEKTNKLSLYNKSDNTLNEKIPYEEICLQKPFEAYTNMTPENELIKMIEETRKDLNKMNILETPSISSQNLIFSENNYEDDIIPQKFNLKPLTKPEIPRVGVNSLSIFDHVKTVKIDCRKFIL